MLLRKLQQCNERSELGYHVVCHMFLSCCSCTAMQHRPTCRCAEHMQVTGVLLDTICIVIIAGISQLGWCTGSPEAESLPAGGACALLQHRQSPGRRSASFSNIKPSHTLCTLQVEDVTSIKGPCNSRAGSLPVTACLCFDMGFLSSQLNARREKV